MVQTVSIPDTKDIQLTKQPTKQTTNISSNTDFLELLLKDIKDTQIKGKDEKSDDSQKDLTDTKDEKSVKLEDLLNNNDDNNKDLKSFIKTDDLNTKIPINLTSDFKDESVKEIKNILTSKMKQDNILLSKTEIKEFKSIDNLKDLMKFADKKGLNVQSIKIDTPKVLDNTIKQVNIKNLNTDTLSENSTQNILKTPKLSTKDILKAQNNKITQPTIHKADTKSLQHKPQSENKISLENILNKSIKQEDVKKSEIPMKVDTKKPIKSVNKEVILDKTDVKKTDKTQIINNTKSLQIPTTKVEHKTINLDSLLNPNKSQINSDEKIKKPEIKMENNINLNSQPTLVNEVKAKSVQAQETIKNFNQNLDEAIKNYKPPVSKINIELNPQNLGKVEVSIIKRGNNIQVHMNTDQNNVAMFQTHQAEFRQALSNIGFTNIDMSFNSNQSSQEKDRKQNQAKKSYQDNEKIEEVGEIDIQASYKYA